MSIETLTDEKIAEAVLKLLDNPMRLIDLRDKLRKSGVLVSYARLKKVIDMLLEQNRITVFKYGKAVMYIKKELLT